VSTFVVLVIFVVFVSIFGPANQRLRG